MLKTFRCCGRTALKRAWSTEACKPPACKPPPPPECPPDCTKLINGLVLGAYTDPCGPGMQLSPAAQRFDANVGGKLQQLLSTKKRLRKAEVYIFNDIGCPKYDSIAVVGLGESGVGFNALESLVECKENIREASAAGVLALEHLGVRNICVDDMSNSESAAEGAYLASYGHYQDFLAKKKRKPHTCLGVYNDCDYEGWEKGVKMAEGQNLARMLEEIPPNVLTPTNFAQLAIKNLCPLGVQVYVRDAGWMEEQCLNAFLRVTRGSCEPPILLELHYCGGNEDDKPIVFVGKGCTFDSGGICLKKRESIMYPKSDISGAAVIVGAFKTIATLGLPINMSGLIPLYENMPGGAALKPGDVVYSLNKKHIRIHDTARTGRVVLSDALTYANNFKPCLLFSIANLISGIETALGTSSSACYTNSDVVWKELKSAGAETGDRVWRMPLWKHFTKLIRDSEEVDVNNIGSERSGDPCTAAAFLKEFSPKVDFVHVDITGTGSTGKGYGCPYLDPKHMTGRPTRTVAQFLNQLCCPRDKPSQCSN